MTSDTDISTLNGLIQTTLDSVKGFEDAAEDGEASRFSANFRDFAQERRQAAGLLQEEVRRQGGNPEDDSGLMGAAHRTFMDLKAMIMSRDEKAVIQEVERGEDYIKNKYEAALSGDLSPQSRAVVEQAYQSVRRGHDWASQLKHSLADS